MKEIKEKTMPISEQVLAIRPQEVGRLKIGGLAAAKRTSQGGREWQAPVKFEHFILTKTVRGKQDNNFVVDIELMRQLAAQGCKVSESVDGSGKPKESSVPRLIEIPIMLGSGAEDQVFPHSLACYVGKSLLCRGTGDGPDGPNPQGATRFELGNDGKPTGRSKKRPCCCEYLTAPQPRGPICKPHGTLWFSLRVGAGTKIGGRHSFRTTSWNSIRAILSGLREIRETVGTFYRIPLWLTYTLHETRRRDGTPTTVQVVGIECRVEDLLALQRDMIVEARSRNEVLQLYSGNPIRLGLPAPADDSETPAERARVAQEFHPAGGVSGGFIDVTVDGDATDESVEFDPETGEVIEPSPSDAVSPEDPADKPADKQSNKPTQPAVPAQGSTQLEAPPNDLMEQIGLRLRDLTIARGFDPMNEAEFKPAMKEVFKQIVVDYLGEDVVVTFKGLHKKQAETVYFGIRSELERIASEDADSAPESEPSPDSDPPQS